MIFCALLNNQQISYQLAWPSEDPCEQARLYSGKYALIVTPMVGEGDCFA